MQCCTMVSENTTFALGWQRNSNFHLMHFKIKTWEMCRWRTFLLPFLPAFWLQGNDLFLSKFSFEKEYISVRMEFATKRRKIYVEFPTVSFPAFCTPHVYHHPSTVESGVLTSNFSEEWVLGYLVSNFAKDLSPNSVTNSPNHQIWWTIHH